MLLKRKKRRARKRKEIGNKRKGMTRAKMRRPRQRGLKNGKREDLELKGNLTSLRLTSLSSNTTKILSSTIKNLESFPRKIGNHFITNLKNLLIFALESIQLSKQ